MGCICSKGISSGERHELKRERTSSKISKRFVASSRRDGSFVADAHATVDGATARLISEAEENTFTPPPRSAIDSGPGNGIAGDGQVPSRKGNGHQRRATVDVRTSEVEPPQVRIGLVPNGLQAENVAAGWPSWLASVAGEALKGWLPRKAESFERLNQIGQGTYSSVYKARDLETGKIVALKKVRFMNMDPESVRFMAREIHVLRRLDHPNIVKLEGLIATKTGCNLYLVFEYMEHDLAGLAATPGIKFSEPQVKCYMLQLLHGLDYCHSHGVLHRDIKGSNLLIDNNGILRIADFGLATFFNPDKKQQFTSRVVTLWYRPPELLLGATEYGVSVDLWSTGCILAELLTGKPIMPGRTEVEQLHKIFKLCGSPSDEYWKKSKLKHAATFRPQQPYRRCIHEAFKDFPSSALALLDNLLALEPENRGTAASALNSDFFNTKPFACDPSSLPKYPPSKEFDAKLREEERRSRQQAAALRRNGPDSVRRNSRESEGVPVANIDAISQNRLASSNHKNANDKYNLLEDGGSVFPIDFSKGMTQNCSWRKKVIDDENLQPSGQPMGSLRRLKGPHLKAQRSYVNRENVDLTALSGLMVSRSSSRSDNYRGRSNRPHLPEQRSQYNRLDVAEASRKQEWTDRLLERPASSHQKDEKTDAEEASSGHDTKKNRIHYSGPLVPPGGNMEEMLKEHERQIQQAVRKARMDKAYYTKKNYG